MTAIHPPATQAGRERMEALLAQLLEVERPALVAAAVTQKGGDAADLAGGVVAQQELARLDDRIRGLQEQLAARPVAHSGSGEGVVVVGSMVSVDFGDGPEERIIGTAGDLAAGADVITADSPLGAALLGRTADADVPYTGPTGETMTVRLTAVQ